MGARPTHETLSTTILGQGAKWIRLLLKGFTMWIRLILPKKKKRKEKGILQYLVFYSLKFLPIFLYHFNLALMKLEPSQQNLLIPVF